MVPRSTPVGEVPPPLSAFYTGLIRRRRGRWKFSSPWHRKNAPYSRFFLVAITILGVDLIPGCARNGGSPPRAPSGEGGGRELFFHDAKNVNGNDFFSEKVSVRGEGPKNGFWRKRKMSRKRVFRKIPIVQGPGFSCKPNTAFFMGYPLYGGAGSDEASSKIKVIVCLY